MRGAPGCICGGPCGAWKLECWPPEEATGGGACTADSPPVALPCERCDCVCTIASPPFI